MISKDLVLHFTLVNTDAPATELEAVEHQIVRLCAHATGVRVKHRHVFVYGEVNGWCIASQRLLSSSHSYIGKSSTQQKAWTLSSMSPSSRPR